MFALIRDPAVHKIPCLPDQAMRRPELLATQHRQFEEKGLSASPEAERNQVQVILLQETRLTDKEALVVEGSPQIWAMFHQAESLSHPVSSSRVEGGVAVLVRKGIPVAKASSWCGKGRSVPASPSRAFTLFLFIDEAPRLLRSMSST